jgi:hypothetical protein
MPPSCLWCTGIVLGTWGTFLTGCTGFGVLNVNAGTKKIKMTAMYKPIVLIMLTPPTPFRIGDGCGIGLTLHDHSFIILLGGGFGFMLRAFLKVGTVYF